MLKIIVTETQAESRWILQGRLVGPWVRELRTNWRKTKRANNGQKCVLDLNEVSFIDKGGERLLRAMSKEGVEFVASGIYTRHVLEGLKTSRKGALSRFSFSPSMRAIESLGHLSAQEEAGTPPIGGRAKRCEFRPLERD